MSVLALNSHGDFDHALRIAGDSVMAYARRTQVGCAESRLAVRLTRGQAGQSAATQGPGRGRVRVSYRMESDAWRVSCLGESGPSSPPPHCTVFTQQPLALRPRWMSHPNIGVRKFAPALTGPTAEAVLDSQPAGDTITNPSPPHQGTDVMRASDVAIAAHAVGCSPRVRSSSEIQNVGPPLACQGRDSLAILLSVSQREALRLVVDPVCAPSFSFSASSFPLSSTPVPLPCFSLATVRLGFVDCGPESLGV